MTTHESERIPRVDVLLESSAVAELVQVFGRRVVRESIHRAQRLMAEGRLATGALPEWLGEDIASHVQALQEVINATGVVLHTNLGRAALSPSAVAALSRASGYVDLEMDRTTGHRRARGVGAAEALLTEMPGADDALVVNNGAAAMALAVRALADGRPVLLSRGEMLEIGGGSRVLDMLQAAGVSVIEVGATNCTSVEDYRAQVSSAGVILQVHRSNFTMAGYVRSPGVSELLGLGLPVVVDLGGGLLKPDPWLSDELSAAQALGAGATLVTFSADKLLGGPQAGVVAGSSEAVSRARRDPFARLVRVDKLSLAALDATVRCPPTPTWTAIHTDPDELKARCDALADAVRGTVVAHAGRVGGGCAPSVELPGWAVRLPLSVAEPLRQGSPAVITRVADDGCLLDLRCVPVQFDPLLAQLVAAAHQ